MSDEKKSNEAKIESFSKYSSKDTVTLIFREDRKYELHIWNDMYTFWGQQPVKVPRSVLTHKDFTEEIKNLFVIQEN